ncbi:MAG: hypothetical protein ABIJ48_05740 [Actinomycetota bacterium]
MPDTPEDHGPDTGLQTLGRHLQRAGDLLAREPSLLPSVLHNSLWLEEGASAGADALVGRARTALAGRVWLQLCNRPPVTTAPVLHTCQHGSTVWALAWRPGDGSLASGGSDGRIRLWEPAHGSLLGGLEPGGGPVNALAWSPDGGTLASGHEDGILRLWPDVGGGKPRETAPLPGAVLSLGWSPDARALALGLSGGELVMLEAGSLGRIADAPPTGEPLRALAWSPDGTTIACPEGRGIVRLRHARTGESRGVLDDAELRDVTARLPSGEAVAEFLLRVLAMAWSPDGATLAVGTGAGVRLWDLATRSAGPWLHRDQPGASALAWYPGGARLVMAVGFGQVWLWEAGTGVEVAVPVGHQGAAHALAWSPDGRRLASADEAGAIVFWDVGTLEELPTQGGAATPSDGVVSLALSGDGTRIASGGAGNTIHQWNALGHEVSVIEQLPGPVLGLAPLGNGFIFSPLSSERTDFVAWERPDRRPRGLWTIDAAAAGCALALSPDGRRLAAGDLVGSVWLFEIENGSLLGVLRMPSPRREGAAPPQPNQAMAVAWSPDSSLVACLAHRGAAVWRIGGEEPLALLPTDDDPAPPAEGPVGVAGAVTVHLGSSGLGWSPDGGLLALAGGSGTVRLWQTRDWEPLAVFHHDARVAALAWSPDGSRLVTGDDAGAVRVWRVGRAVVEAAALCVSGLAALRFGTDPATLYAADDGKASLGRPLLYAFRLVEAQAAAGSRAGVSH